MLLVRGADLLDGTPIFDVKPYVPLADCRPQAVGGFSDQHREDGLSVDFPPALPEQVPEEKLGVMMGTASLITAMAPAVGPSLGGFIVNHFGWRMVFIALLLFRATRHLPHNREAKMPSVFWLLSLS